MDRPIPKYSQAAVFHSSGNPICLQQFEIPQLKRREILIRNEYATLCRSDLNTFTGKRREKCPTILGHEIVGRIVAFGADAPGKDLRASPLEIGDRVTWSIYASNPDSPLSRMGIPQKGDGLFKYGHEQLTETNTLHGGLSEYCILRAHTAVIKLEEAVPLEVGATINCAGATVAGALRLAGNICNKTVAVSGAGMLGVFACAMSKVGKAKRIIAIDTNPERLETAQQFGAHETLLAADLTRYLQDTQSSSGTGRFDIVIELSGACAAMESTLDGLSIGGTAVWVGAVCPQERVRIDAEKIVRRLNIIKGLHNYNEQDLLTAVRFMEEHHATFPFGDLINDRFSLEQVQDAFACALESNHHRVGIRITS